MARRYTKKGAQYLDSTKEYKPFEEDIKLVDDDVDVKKLYSSVVDTSSSEFSPGEDMDGNTEDPMFGKDESELSNMGEEPLSEGFDFAGLFDKIGKTDFEGVGGGGKEEKSKISQITGANDPTRGSSSFSPVANPYTAGLPKYSQSSGNYMQLAQQIFGLLSPVRKPNISSLV
jgi:hypothetical protein|tara:strand:+ start:96 stop:614 length:519 start_codon:yes stop_codon:yes gene_type:complete